jgi:hypothetical protein
MSESDDKKPKIGEGHAAAMGRLGLRELRAAAYPDSNVAQHPEYGLYGTKTPGEVAESRRADDRELDEESTVGSVLGKWTERGQENREGLDRSAKELERG